MAGKPGRSGTNRQLQKPFADAVRAVCGEVKAGDHAGRRKLRVIAEKLVDLAMDGDLDAIKEISNRLDGKAAQQLAITGEDGGPIKSQVTVLIGTFPEDGEEPADGEAEDANDQDGEGEPA